MHLGFPPHTSALLPKYLSLDTIGAVCHHLIFSALISILYFVQVLLRLSTRASSSCSSSARAFMSSANRRLVIFLPPMLTFPSCSSRASDMVRFRKMLKRVGDRRHPCLTPTVILNHSPMLPFIWTALIALSQSCSMMRTRFALMDWKMTEKFGQGRRPLMAPWSCARY